MVLGPPGKEFSIHQNHTIHLPSLRRGRGDSETHVFVHCTFINLIKGPNEETLIFLVPASLAIHFMFWCRSCDERMSFMMDSDYKTYLAVQLRHKSSVRTQICTGPLNSPRAEFRGSPVRRECKPRFRYVGRSFQLIPFCKNSIS